MKTIKSINKNIILNITLIKIGVGFTMKFTMKPFSLRNGYLFHKYLKEILKQKD